MADFVRVAGTDEIPVGTIKAFEINHVRFVVAHAPAGYFAVANECSHDGAPIEDGRIRGDSLIMCARHGARFDLATGAVAHPPAIVPIDRYDVRVDGDDILVRIEE